MRLDCGAAEVRVEGWIPVHAVIDAWTDDAGLLIAERLPARSDELLHVDGFRHGPETGIRVSSQPNAAPSRARARGLTRELPHRVRVELTLGGHDAKPAAYAESVRAAMTDLVGRIADGGSPRSGAAEGAAAVAVATRSHPRRPTRESRAALLHTCSPATGSQPSTMRRGDMSPQVNPHAEFPLGPFRPHEGNPILKPQGDGWESASVYNPAAVVKDGKVVLLYRAHADDIVSHVGLATSDDGLNFDRHPEPVLSPTEPYEKFGAEDPRVTEIDGTYYMTYTGWDGTSAQLCLATSDGPVHVDQARPAVPGLQHVPPAGQRAGRSVEQGRRDPARPDRRPLPHVLRRGLDLSRVVRRPDLTGSRAPTTSR